jgi:hypothetical protein
MMIFPPLVVIEEELFIVSSPSSPEEFAEPARVQKTAFEPWVVTFPTPEIEPVALSKTPVLVDESLESAPSREMSFP